MIPRTHLDLCYSLSYKLIKSFEAEATNNSDQLAPFIMEPLSQFIVNHLISGDEEAIYSNFILVNMLLHQRDLKKPSVLILKQ